jgi:hypothetical protein
MKTYLSIDLDYFNDRDNSMLGFFAKVFSMNKPIHVQRYHHELLPDIDASGCEKLINIDFHSDVCDPWYGLNEGTWVNFVQWRAAGCYEWRYPGKVTAANYCHQDGENPFVEQPEWASLTMKRGLAISWAGITHIGVCLSPDWVQRRPALYQLMDKLGMSWSGYEL